MKNIFYLIAVVVGLMFAHIVDATEPMQMTMTLKPDGEVILIMAGSGTVTIDWEDKSPSETYTLLVYDKEDWQNDWQKYTYSHVYSRKSARTITITDGNITHLECNHLKLTSLDISRNTALTNLYCKANQLTSLDVSNNSALTTLDCSGNQLISLDVSKNKALSELVCDYNKLPDLDVSENIALTELVCSNNKLKYLDVSKNTALTTLNCSENQLKNLEISKNTLLTNFYCDHNQLTSLDVSKNIALTKLVCDHNQLTSLDVSKNIALTYLYCPENQLTNLDVSNNTALRYLTCGKNQLTGLDVSSNTELVFLSFGFNQLTEFYAGINTKLVVLDCFGNQLSASALDTLFGTLHSDTISGGKGICFSFNPGADTCDKSIATDKGWEVICPAWRLWKEEVDSTLFGIVDTPPLFEGKEAEEGFREYVSRKTVYPMAALLNGIQGTVLVEFAINTQGKVVDAKVVLNAHPLLDARALRVINSSPKWTPGMVRGKKVKVKYTFPVSFRMN